MSVDPFSLHSYTYDLPKELIAQYPIEPRDQAKLLIVDRKSGRIEEGRVTDLVSFLEKGDALIFNNTKVLHAALKGELEPHTDKKQDTSIATKERSLTKAEEECEVDCFPHSVCKGNRTQPVSKGKKAGCCLLTRECSPTRWWALTKPAKLFSVGTKILFDGSIEAVVEESGKLGERLLSFSTPITPELLQKIGEVPLPPYIRRQADNVVDAKRYQTVYATHFGSIAAPTAGLHFTEELLSSLEKKGIHNHHVTLHVGTGTFLPIREKDIRDHAMHTERFEVREDVAKKINQTPSRKIAVGTTSCRVLESIAGADGHIKAQSGQTNLYITPGYEFKAVDALFTNFHTPGSSLLVLMSAFMGYELMKEAYAKAIENRFRFFSYGDAMIIL